VQAYGDMQSVHKWGEHDHIIGRNMSPHSTIQYNTISSVDDINNCVMTCEQTTGYLS
jgi:hypothetical protein